MAIQVNPYLVSEDAKSQANFYAETIGGEILSLSTYGEAPGTPEALKDKVMHLVLTLAGSNTLMMSDSFEPVTGSRISLALNYDSESEAKTAFDKLSKGGEIKYPFELQPWGAFHYGEVFDKFGVLWRITKQ